MRGTTCKRYEKTPLHVQRRLFLRLQGREHHAARFFSQRYSRHTASSVSDGEAAHVRRRAQTLSRQQEAEQQHQRVAPAAQKGDGHAGALLDGRQLAGPVEVGHLQAQRQSQQG